MKKDQEYMLMALELAQSAYKAQEVPIGAVVVSGSDEVLSKAFNSKEALHNPCGHAEILALQSAAKKLSNWRLSGCTLYTTLEPCPMCLNAMTHARIARVVFGAYDAKGGAIHLGYNFYQDKRLNHRFGVLGGILAYQSATLLTSFFHSRRK
ncbi:MAG: nucleoside deaminase [Bacteriovoracaceae bacterium]|nr:nucleoside deaminase [Bacteriovoracaceae bacterium]